MLRKLWQKKKINVENEFTTSTNTWKSNFQVISATVEKNAGSFGVAVLIPYKNDLNRFKRCEFCSITKGIQ